MPNFHSELLLFRKLVLSRLRLHTNWFKVVPKTVSGPFWIKTRGPSAIQKFYKQWLRVQPKKLRGFRFKILFWPISKSKTHYSESGSREVEAGHWNNFQSKQEFSKIEQKWHLPFLREFFCKFKWISKGGEGENLKPVSVCCSVLAVFRLFYLKKKKHQNPPHKQTNQQTNAFL